MVGIWWDEMKIDIRANEINNNFNEIIQQSSEIKTNELNDENNNLQNFDPDQRIEVFDFQDSLKPFEYTLWQKLDAVEIDHAIENLKDTIAKDLNLENIPKIGYYYEESTYDMGAYSSIDNCIYINCYCLDAPEKIVRTIAHELRHCWQEEQINAPDNLQSDFVKILKFNNENYIDPYDNYESYWNQPMEIDARMYVERILSNMSLGYVE